MDQGEPTFHQELVFDANLQEFAMTVGVICGLEAGGKISQAEVYLRIRNLWKQLKRSKKNLRIGEGQQDADG